MPSGLAVWTAFWLTGSNFPSDSTWAAHGEIDIIEGVNSVDLASSFNTTTLHTNAKPGVAKCDQSGISGISNDGNCESGKDSGCGWGKSQVCPYNGCGVKSNNNKTFGYGFNQNKGGVYACELTSGGQITVWFFPRSNIPEDIVSNKPQPDLWPTDNIVSFKPCAGQFKSMQLILNTTLCGEWAGNDYNDGKGNSGWGSCKGAIEDPRYKLSEAYWLINYVKIFKA